MGLQSNAWRMARAGAPFERIARQLRQRDMAMVVKVYGRLKPDTEEAIVGAARQRARLTATRCEREVSNDSRGGTRTRDPGIMSAVL